MRSLVLLMIVVVARPSLANADSRCITLEGSTLINRCQSCTEVTAHELRPPAEQAAGLFTGVSRTTRLEAGTQEKLPVGGGWILSDLKDCR